MNKGVLKFTFGFFWGWLMATLMWCSITGMGGLIIAGDQVSQVGTVTVNENPIYWIGQSFHSGIGLYLGVSLILGLVGGFTCSNRKVSKLRILR